MAPKASARVVAKVVQTSALDATFPLWADFPVDEPKEGKSKADKEAALEKFEDAFGTQLPSAAEAFLDTWKRPEELVLNQPDIPMLRVKPSSTPTETTKAAKGSPASFSRDHEGRLFPGHKSFEWLKSVFDAVISAQKRLPPTTYLWELIYPKDPKEGTTTRSPNGKYRVKLFIMGEWRAVTVDDRLPVDLFGQFLVVGVRPLQLWPMILCKAVLKVMAAQRVLGLNLPHQVAAFRLLTGWPQEDLVDPLCGTQLLGGFLFDRLEDVVAGNINRPLERSSIGTACLITRALPERPPPRIIVLVGPSGVGRSGVLARLAAVHPGKFGIVVGHTTRQPHEHEVHGRDYFFTDKQAFRAEVEANMLLQHACVSGISDTYMYGTRLAAVREVAATGRICLIGLDIQGVKTLRANHRIDGLYLFITPPSLEELEVRQRGRLKEADSTIAKRLTWAEAEIAASAKPHLYHHIVENNEGTKFDLASETGVYYQLKEAISSLSPIVRNRLRGLPAYVLDYSDLIPPNLVEKPFLKPVVVSGPTTGERTALLEQLVREFPDVFAFPVVTTTRFRNEIDQHRVGADELAMIRAPPVSRVRTVSPPSKTGHSLLPEVDVDGLPLMPGTIPDEEVEELFEELPKDASLYPDTIVMTPEEFDEAVRSGSLVEHHQDLFKHANITRRTGVSKAAIRNVLLSGKLPLLELESDALVMLSQLKSGDLDIKIANDMYLGIFLKPPSMEEYKTRLVQWLTETDEDIAMRLELAKTQIAASSDAKVYDHVVVNDQLEDSVGEIIAMMHRYRPDVMNSVEDGIEGEEETAGPTGENRPSSAASSTVARPAAGADAGDPVLVLVGPPGSNGQQQLAEALRTAFPDKFIVPPLLTDRKPSKGEASSAALTFMPPKEFAKMAAEGLHVVSYPSELHPSSSVAISKDALLSLKARNAVAVIALPQNVPAGLPASLKLGGLPMAVYLYVNGVAGAVAGAAGQTPEMAEAALAAVQESEIYHLIIPGEMDSETQLSLTRSVMTAHVPSVVPPPFRPLVVAGPFGTGKRVLLQRLFDQLPGRFAVPVITTSREAGPKDIGDRTDMEVVPREAADALLASNAFLVHEVTLDHVYGVTIAAVNRVKASGRVCVVEVDHVEDAKKLRDQGFDATYIFIGVDSMDELFKRVHAEIKSNPPLGYEMDEAAHIFFQGAKAEVMASRVEGLFDATIDNGTDFAAAFTHLAEAVHFAYPDVVVRHFVWGYGRSLWDLEQRKHGEHPLRVMVLGPAGSGKTTQCEMLSKHFQVPHVNVGDLLYDEVKIGSEVGLAAKVFMDASKTVPDEYFITLLDQRLKRPDCRASGWMLDGFPHTAPQTAALLALGIIPDKVIFLYAENEVLLDRTRHRKIDYLNNRVYHVPARDAHAICPAIEPIGKDGKLDAEVMARLHPRHDDSEENVVARLGLWDIHWRHLRAAYEDVSLRLAADTPTVADPFDAAVTFLTLESRVTEVPVLHSSKLKQLQYEIVDTMRYKRQQLVQLQHTDERALPWVDVKELASNSHCVLLGRDPEQFEPHQQRRRSNLYKAPRSLLMLVDSPEPSEVLISLDLGVQWALEDRPAVAKMVLVVCGPVGSGKTTVIDMLMRDFPKKLARVSALSTRASYKEESLGRPYTTVHASELASELALGEALGYCSAPGEEGMYAASLADLEDAWREGKVAVMEAPLALAEALKAAHRQAAGEAPGAGATAAAIPDKIRGTLADMDVRCVYLTADVETLDTRLRRAAMREEQRLGEELKLSKEEVARVAALGGTDGSMVDWMLPAAGTEQEVYMAVREVAGGLWHRPRMAVPCQLVVDRFDWRANLPGPTELRMRTSLSAGATLELPRGRHLLRVSANLEQLHSVTFMSTTKLSANEYVEVMQEAEPAPCISSCLEGEYVALPAGTCCALLRYNIKVAEPTTLAATLAISGEDLRACTQLALVNNATGEESVVPLARLPATELLPSPEGYTIVALTDVPRAPTLLPVRPGSEAAAARTAALASGADAPAGGVADDGAWALTMTASRQPTSIDPVSVQRVQVLEGTYEPNSRWVLARQLLVPTMATQLAVVVTTEPAVPFLMQVMQVPAGAEVSWTGTYPIVLERAAPSGSLTLHNIQLSPGKYVVRMVLQGGETCAEGLQPSPVDGSLVGGGGPVSWRAVYIPSTDERICPVVADDSLQRYFKTMFESWGAVAAGATAAKGAKPAAGSVPGGGPRAQQAAAVLERCTAEVAAAAQAAASGEGPPMIPSRTMKDGSSLALKPESLISVVGVPVEEAVVLSKEELAERAAAATQRVAEAAAAPPEPVGAGLLTSTLELGKSSRGAQAARRAAEFSEWRSQCTQATGGALNARALAMQRIKQLEAVAAEAAALEAASASSLPPATPPTPGMQTVI